MSEQPSNAEPSPGLVVQTIFILAVIVGVPSVFALGGRLHFLALAAISILLLAGFPVVGYRHTRRRKSLHQHVAFLVVWFGSIVLANRLTRMANGCLPEPGPYLVAMGVTLGALWLGSQLTHGGALTQALFGSDWGLTVGGYGSAEMESLAASHFVPYSHTPFSPTTEPHP